MIIDYGRSDNRFVGGFVSSIDEKFEDIQIALGFYMKLTSDSLSSLPHVDVSLIKTKKKDEFTDSSRQDNLLGLEEGDEITLSYSFETETYVVSDEFGSELGEIGKKHSEILWESEDDDGELAGYILRVDDSDLDNIKCKVRVFYDLES